MLFAGAEKAEK